ncbi:ClpXP protease specificity-enhancing factor / Stringent starvation protein B [Paraburkholderia tropica]|uniref:ClpXP protease specificity-enhancing factor n=1 Tax=Paraburkholderia TaxID=1822464 RepID=UPI001CB08467|nr:MULTISPECIES: ClpXP protease specificity-enhancing factor [Paraburkholderia]CAG9215429.1 ClpXP protease specificity-enhancing factor / Stringent starvation protein B [Paraburkholderia tropica]
MQEISTKPYLLRALYEWCTDNGFTPHIAVRVDNRTRVPRQFVRDGEIVLNISFEATSQLQMGNEMIEFHARFSGKSHKIEVPVSNVLAIYARENGQGMAFPVEAPPGDANDVLPSAQDEHEDTAAPAVVPTAGPTAVPSVAPAAVQSETDESAVSAKTGKGDSGDDGAAKGGKGHLKIVK